MSRPLDEDYAEIARLVLEARRIARAKDDAMTEYLLEMVLTEIMDKPSVAGAAAVKRLSVN